MTAHRLILSTLCKGAAASIAAETPALVHLANPLQGTDSVREFSYGNTYPAIAPPFVVNAKSNGPQGPYIRSAKLNDMNFNKTFLQHPQITGGGELTFEMSSAPDHS